MLEIKDLCFSVDTPEGHKDILKDISFAVPGGQFVVITGPNGSGKSTLAKIIMGIEQPTAGRILLDGEDITELSITERAERGIGFAFQQPVRFKGLSVKDLVELAAGRELSIEQVCEYLSEVGLCALDYVERPLDATLSGGELKRIEIAMLLARGTKVSLFDEPEAGIDLWSFHNLIRVFENMRRKTNGSIIIISHQERILDIADQIIVLTQGEISASGNKAEILPGLLAGADTCTHFKEDVYAG